MDDILVTIITITRNRAGLIPRAIKSVLAQTYRNFEYLIIDGASTDNTSEVVNSFHDDRIRYFSLKENISAIESIDYGISNSLGSFISFLDDDDEYLPGKIEKQLKLIVSLPEEYGFVYCWMDYYDDKKNEIVKEWHPKLRGNVFTRMLEQQSIGGTPSLFLRREAYLKTGGWNRKLKYVADWEFSTRLSEIYLTDYVPEVLIKVHINHGYQRMMTGAMSVERIQSLIQFHQHYLSEYSGQFELNPKLSVLHLNSLAMYFAMLNDFGQSIFYLKKSMQIRFFSTRWMKKLFKISILYLRRNKK